MEWLCFSRGIVSRSDSGIGGTEELVVRALTADAFWRSRAVERAET